MLSYKLDPTQESGYMIIISLLNIERFFVRFITFFFENIYILLLLNLKLIQECL